MHKLAATMFAALPLAILGGNAGASEGGKSSIEGVNFVPLAPIVVPIIESDRVVGSLRVTVVIDAIDPVAADHLTADLPRIREMAMAASLEFARLHASGVRPVNAELLDHDLKAALVRTDPAIARILITEVSAKIA